MELKMTAIRSLQTFVKKFVRQTRVTTTRSPVVNDQQPSDQLLLEIQNSVHATILLIRQERKERQAIVGD